VSPTFKKAATRRVGRRAAATGDLVRNMAAVAMPSQTGRPCRMHTMAMAVNASRGISW
jgi:hypothetical protein